MQLSPNDAELLNLDFKTSNPLALSNLSTGLPYQYEKAEIEFSYDIKPPKNTELDYLWCAHCQKKTHWKGYVLITSEKTRFMIGVDCGKKIYGLDFQKVENSFKEFKDRQWDLRNLIDALDIMPKALAEIQNLLFNPIFDELSELRDSFRYRLPELNRQIIQSVIANDNFLVAEQRVRDIAAEEKRADRTKHIHEELENKRITKQITLTQMKKEKKNLREMKSSEKPIYKIIEDEISRLNSPLEFFEIKNLLRIKNWAELAQINDIFEVTRNSIAINDNLLGPSNEYCVPYVKSISRVKSLAKYGR